MLLLDCSELLSDGRAVLALMTIENLLHLQDALAPELVLAPLLGLLGVRPHQLCSSIRKLWNSKRLSLWRLLLDLGIVHRLEEIVLSL